MHQMTPSCPACVGATRIRPLVFVLAPRLASKWRRFLQSVTRLGITSDSIRARVKTPGHYVGGIWDLN